MTTEFNIPTIIRALGRGKKGTRNLSEQETYFVMTSILEGTITEAQLGAFLMLMRVKEETAEELSGMIAASNDQIGYQPKCALDVNMPAYAGKKKQPSWYLLAAKLLANNGVSIFIHGGGEHTAGRQYAVNVCSYLGIPFANTLDHADSLINDHNICYLALSEFAPTLSKLIDMKAELGLRSPVNTLVRHLNPLKAKLTLQGMFHPAYMPLHHDTAQRLQQVNNIVLKGDGGEFEVRPDSKTSVSILSLKNEHVTSIEPVLKQRSIRPEKVELSPLTELWNNESEQEYGEAAVLQTATLILSQLEALPHDEAHENVLQWWQNR